MPDTITPHYANMDHAGWVQRQIKSEMSPLARKVADVIGYTFNGIYNAPINTRKTDWTDTRCISVIQQHGTISNWDFCELSKLWVRCHRECLRVTISAAAPHRLRLLFHQRDTREGSVSRRMPDCEEIIAMVDADFAGRTDPLPSI